MGLRALPAGAITEGIACPPGSLSKNRLRSLRYSSWFPESILGDGAHRAWSQASPGVRQRGEHGCKLSQIILDPLLSAQALGLRGESETWSPSLSWVCWFPVASKWLELTGTTPPPWMEAAPGWAWGPDPSSLRRTSSSLGTQPRMSQSRDNHSPLDDSCGALSFFG